MKKLLIFILVIFRIVCIMDLSLNYSQSHNNFSDLEKKFRKKYNNRNIKIKWNKKMELPEKITGIINIKNFVKTTRKTLKLDIKKEESINLIALYFIKENERFFNIKIKNLTMKKYVRLGMNIL